MSDDRLFASNGAIGRKFYFINFVVLFLIAFATHYVFQNYIIPNAQDATYKIIATYIEYFVYLIYVITAFSLVDRRLYDVAGGRRNSTYTNIAAIFSLILIANIVLFLLQNTPVTFPIPASDVQYYTDILNKIGLVLVVGIGLWKGQITNLSFAEYKHKIKYD